MSSADNKISELNEQLLPQEDLGGFGYDAKCFAGLFNQDDCKDLYEGSTVSKSLHKLQEDMGGVEAIAKNLHSDLVHGISGTELDLDRRRKQFGDNKRVPKKIKSVWDLFLDNFEDLLLKILLAAAAVSLVTGIISEGPQTGWIEGAGIFAACAIILVVNTSQNYIKEKQFQELQNKQDVCTARVMRSGLIMTLDSEELVVGDVLIIPSGDTIPADCVIFKSFEFIANEASLTGEPEGEHKAAVDHENYHSNPNPFLLQSTLAETGNASALVLAVGKNTFSGKAERMMDVPELTPLQCKLNTIADVISWMGGTAAALTFLAMVIKLLITIFVKQERELSDPQNLNDFLNAFILAVTILVVAVPEGLPLAVAISLSFSVGEMFKLGNLVRQLRASETMGGAHEICTDKTGTLTQNKMTVQAFFVNNSVVTGDKINMESLPNHELIGQAIMYNSSAYIGMKQDPLTKQLNKTAIGNVTECGIMNYLQSSGFACEELISHRTRDNFDLLKIPFSSSRKRETSVVTLPDGKIRVFVKGAPEILIRQCKSYTTEDGSVHAMDEDKRRDVIERVVKDFAIKSYRNIMVTYADISHHDFERMRNDSNNFKTGKECVEDGLTMIGIFALMDPLRPGIADAVDTCRKAGINVRMCTGDNIDTAIAIAKQSHILTPEDIAALEDSEHKHFICMTGKAFEEHISGLVSTQNDVGLQTQTIGNMRAFREIQKHLKVLARSQPEHKFMLVTGLKQCNSVVAVTGDGNNDVPALNKADVGFAMGIAGTDVCKSASDIVLTKDDFCTIIVAILYGRNIYDNVRKFLQFQLTVNVAACIVVFIGAVFLSDEAMTAVQMLWVNLIMDTLAALALATEPPSDVLLERAPYSRHDKIINAVMWRNIFGNAFYQIVALLVLIFDGARIFNLQNYDKEEPFFVTESWATENQYNENTVLATLADDAIQSGVFNLPTEKCILFTIVFQAFVMMTIFNILNARKLGDKEYNIFSNFFNNVYFFLILILITLGQFWITQNGGMVVRTSGLNTKQHIICAIFGVLTLPWAAFVKAVLPSAWFESFTINEEEMKEEDVQHSIVGSLRKSLRESYKGSTVKLSQNKIN